MKKRKKRMFLAILILSIACVIVVSILIGFYLSKNDDSDLIAEQVKSNVQKKVSIESAFRSGVETILKGVQDVVDQNGNLDLRPDHYGISGSEYQMNAVNNDVSNKTISIKVQGTVGGPYEGCMTGIGNSYSEQEYVTMSAPTVTCGVRIQ